VEQEQVLVVQAEQEAQQDLLAQIILILVGLVEHPDQRY
jgi:hypothetical protein